MQICLNVIVVHIKRDENMQTFLPYSDFVKSARCLDYRRLGKQRVEVKQIFHAILFGNGWRNHPTVKMWKGYEYYLILYGCIICCEWKSRGYKDSLLKYFIECLILFEGQSRVGYPKWFGRRTFHNSHKSNLLRKDKKYYSKFGWKVSDNLPYIWPEK
jgi:hypothetical protein